MGEKEHENEEGEEGEGEGGGRKYYRGPVEEYFPRRHLQQHQPQPPPRWFANQSKAAADTGISVASINQCIHGK